MKRLMVLLVATLLLSVLPINVLSQGGFTAEKLGWPDSVIAGFWELMVAKNGDIFAAVIVMNGVGVSPLYHSSDDGKNWTKFDIPSDVGFGVIQDPITNAIIVGTWHGMFRSTDNGKSWQRPPVDSQSKKVLVRKFALDQNGNIFAGASGRIYKSNNGGESWITVFYDPTETFSVMDIAISPNGTIFAATGGTLWSNHGLLRSTDGGKTWQWANNGLSRLKLYSVAADQSGVIWLATYDDGLYRSTDNGESWHKTNHPDPYYINDILPIRPDFVFASSLTGLFLFNGQQWSQLGPPPNSADVLAAKGGALFVSGYASRIDTVGGLWLFRDIITAVEEEPNIPTAFQLSQNYPNPFNPTTTIEFSLPERSFVRLSVFNVLGQEIQMLVSGEKEPGVHRVVWNAGDLPSGIYFYRLETPKFQAVKKMLLVK